MSGAPPVDNDDNNPIPLDAKANGDVTRSTRYPRPRHWQRWTR